MTRTPIERHHWVNAFVGILDQAFYLTDAEQVCVIEIVDRMFTSLSVPQRGNPVDIPMSLALEAADGFYSRQLAGPRNSGVVRPVRHVVDGDMVVSVDAWCESLVGMVIVAYPDLTPAERLAAAKIVTDLLVAVGVPDRAANYYPADVLRVANQLDS
ncbi:MAG: hypothetical protein GY882_01640 [Actinomycetia bacterium]|nr:hypothetical protein [Actinomycetes bacterium]MCP4844873.1 hypothetical protein [Actinomycetes bacterium]